MSDATACPITWPADNPIYACTRPIDHHGDHEDYGNGVTVAQCRVEYRPERRDPTARIVRCQLDAGHPGSHEEVFTGGSWQAEPAPTAEPAPHSDGDPWAHWEADTPSRPDLDAIAARARPEVAYGSYEQLAASADDVPTLLAYVRRLEAAAGRLADPQQQERLAKAERDLAQIRADWWTVSAERDRNMDRAHAEIERLRARVAELEQTLHEIANLAATTPVDEPRVAIDNLGEIVRRARQEQPGRWELPAEPGPEVRCVRTDDRRHWARTIGGDLWVHPPGGPIRWEALLALSAATVCNCIPANPTTEHGCDDCSVEPGETHRWPGCPGAVRARQRMATPPETAGGGDDA